MKLGEALNQLMGLVCKYLLQKEIKKLLVSYMIHVLNNRRANIE